MDKSLAALLGAVGALVSMGPAHAASQPVEAADILHAGSYADLLRPIPNAVDQLRALEQAELAAPPATEPAPMLYQVQYHHHHHHHHRYVRRHHHHHHHHHVAARVLNDILRR